MIQAGRLEFAAPGLGPERIMNSLLKNVTRCRKARSPGNTHQI